MSRPKLVAEGQTVLIPCSLFVSAHVADFHHNQGITSAGMLVSDYEGLKITQLESMKLAKRMVDSYNALRGLSDGELYSLLTTNEVNYGDKSG